jgi:hypothetical protein
LVTQPASPTSSGLCLPCQTPRQVNITIRISERRLSALMGVVTWIVRGPSYPLPTEFKRRC